MNCRHCGFETSLCLADLGTAPPSNEFLSVDQLSLWERYYPLRVLVCENCWLAQIGSYTDDPSLFPSDYVYFSSYSDSWLEHAKTYVTKMAATFGLDKGSMVTEIAANDGYLLQFVKELGIPNYGIEPTRSTADKARQKGIDIVEEFFGTRLASELSSKGRQADLMIANNVLAHVPDINDFVKGFSILLKPDGVATFEFPHLTNLVKYRQFDTIYHEHISYLSLSAVESVFQSNGLSVFDAEEIPTHGGSLRVYAQRTNSGQRATSRSREQILELEMKWGVKSSEFYRNFQFNVDQIKNDLVSFLISARGSNKTVVGYGAAAKGNTLLNYAGIRGDLIKFVVDRSPFKQHKYLPGSRIPVLDPEVIKDIKPDYILILPWNIKDEIMQQLDFIRNWGGQFVTAVPTLKIY